MVAIFVLDAAHRCRFLNNVAEYLTGVPLHQAVNRSFRDVIWQRHPAPYDDTDLAKAIDRGDAEGEETVVARDGVARLFAFRIVSLTQGGLRDGSVVELIDLSGETGTARALRESEQRLRLAVEATGIGIWDVNATSGERRWSTEFLAILGLPPEETPDTKKFSQLVHPDDRAWVDDLYARAYASPEAGGFDAEFRILRANDGVERWVSSHGRITFDEAGRALRGIGTLRDITERREAETEVRLSEERNRLAIEANHAGTWDYDIAAQTHVWSDTYKRLWGLPADAPADPTLLEALVGPTDRELISERWKKAQDPAGNGRLEIEHQLHRADDGSGRWCAIIGQIFFDDGRRKAVRATGIMLDITDRKAAETRQRLVLREMNHRVKNSLSVVQAIVSQTVRLTPNPQLAFERIQSRLMALARTHDFLNKEDWRGVSIRTLVRGEVDPFMTTVQSRIALAGDDVVLDSSSTLALGLILHELAVNAATFGALSGDNGQLQVAWRVLPGSPQPTLDLIWTESGGPSVRAPNTAGFGTRVIQANARGTLGGSVDLRYPPTGVECHIAFPLKPAVYEEVLPEQAAAERRI